MSGLEASQNSKLDPLFRPLDIRGLSVENRFVMAPMTRSRSPGGVPGPDVAAYYERRAKGDVGLIITEGIGIPHPSAIGYSGVDVLQIPDLFGDAALAGWRRVVEDVHTAGGKIVPQLWHQGPMRTPGTGASPDAESLRPSGLWGPIGRNSTVPQDYIDRVAGETRPMTDSEIGDVIAAYAKAASNAAALGFDGIAVHGAHGYLIDTFFWSETNRRTDRWGGDIKARSAFGAAVIAAIREAVGEDLPIFLRWSQWKQQDFDTKLAQTPAELEAMLAPLVDAGVDVFDVSTRNFDNPAFEGSPINLAGWTRRLSGKKTMMVGSVGLSRGMHDSHRLDGADAIDNIDAVVRRFENEEYDLVGVGRMLVAHPDWVQRVRTGQPVKRYDRSFLAELV